MSPNPIAIQTKVAQPTPRNNASRVADLIFIIGTAPKDLIVREIYTVLSKTLGIWG